MAEERAEDVCACGAPGQQPWRTREEIFSPASILWALPYYVVLLLVWPTPRNNAIGLVMLATPCLFGVVAFALALRRGHRLWCSLRRGLWIGFASVGVPFRFVAGAALW